jgi:hypothetical protein
MCRWTFRLEADLLSLALIAAVALALGDSVFRRILFIPTQGPT